MKRKAAIVVAVLVVLGAVWWRRDRVRPGPPPGAAGVEVPAGGAHDASGRVGRATPDDLRARPRAAIRGTVRTTAGRPIAGAQVCSRFVTDGLASDEWRTPPCATTDAAGAYTLDELLPVRHALAASAAEHQAQPWVDATGAIESLALAPGEVRTGVDFALPPGGVKVSGTVEDVSGGPIDGALVVLSGRAVNVVAATTRTDARGRFAVWTAPGRVELRAHADGYASGDVDAQAPTERARLYLTPASTLSGTVITTADARPVEGALVAVTIDADREATARSDAQGRFRLTRMVPGRYKPIASGDGYHGEADGSVLLGLGQDLDGVVIAVQPAGRVWGTVVIDRGQGTVEPCRRGSVTLTDPTSGLGASDWLTLAGTFALASMEPGRYAVRVRCNDHAAQDHYPAVTVRAGADVADLRFVVTPGAVIAGKVTTATGAPVVDAWVSARATDAGAMFPSAFARSHGDGAYRLTGLRGGTYQLEAHAVGHADAPPLPVVAVAAGGVAAADVVFPASGSVAGVVVDAAGRPVPDVQVAVGDQSPDAWATTRDDGSFHIDGVAPGRHRAAVRGGRFEPVRRPGELGGESVAVVAGQTATVRLVIERQDGAITGIVRDTRGEAVADAWIVATREADGPGGAPGAGVRAARWAWGSTDRPVLTGSDGRFTVSGLAEGRYTVRGYRRGGGETAIEHAAIGSDLTLTIPSAGSIGGTVAIARGGAPDAFEIVVFDVRTGFERRERFRGTSGGFIMRDLPAGRFIVVADSTAGRGQATVPLAADEDQAHVAIVLESKVAVTGRFVDLATGAPVPGIRAQVTPTVGPGAGVPSISAERGSAEVSDSGGRFTVRDAPRGLVYVVGLNPEREARWPFVRWIVTVPGDAMNDVGDVPMVARRDPGDGAPGDFGWSFAQPAPDADPRSRSLTLSAVRPGPAAAAGLVAGDTIITVDGHDVRGLRVELGVDLLSVPAGATVTVGLARGGERSLTARAVD